MPKTYYCIILYFCHVKIDWYTFIIIIILSRDLSKYECMYGYIYEFIQFNGCKNMSTVFFRKEFIHIVQKCHE